ncbi:MAG: fructosamine kinase [Bacteroidetes bacterium]|nr:MAG: fructosamine kinase [Bacteroidota bacterium]
MQSHILSTIAERHQLCLSQAQTLAGGDTNAVYRCDSAAGPVVLKYNEEPELRDIFTKEVTGLEALRAAEAFVIPQVYAHGHTELGSYLVLEYLPPGQLEPWSVFGRRLAQLHARTAPKFGFSESNYIGRLVQYNDPTDQAGDFFVSQRLEPQFRLAQRHGYTFSKLDQLYRRAMDLIPHQAPALLHGDLWRGNCLLTERGFALIDPAVSYGPREMDLAMMRLFGGFPEAAFMAYEAHNPSTPGLAERIPLYQLYYVLVHVNMFGGGYYEQAQAIVRAYL